MEKTNVIFTSRTQLLYSIDLEIIKGNMATWQHGTRPRSANITSIKSIGEQLLKHYQKSKIVLVLTIIKGTGMFGPLSEFCLLARGSAVW